MIELSNYDAVIFDMDGVLVDSEPLWKIAMKEVFSSLGSNLEKSDFQKTVGLRIDEVIAYWKPIENWTPEINDIETEIIVKMVRLINNQSSPLPGVIETLDFLKSKTPIGLATSSPQKLIDAVLNTLDVKEYFDAIQSAETEAHGKPHPAVFLSAANKMNVRPENCLVIEDSLNGIIAAKAARMEVVCIPEKTHFPNPKMNVADFQFENMNDFLNQIK
tara:strand:- start:23 stop:676 length:654 start_codon:yes stop_codon:yes gene_type:complete